MVAKLTRLTHKTVRELYHLWFSLQVASLEAFGYTLVYLEFSAKRSDLQEFSLELPVIAYIDH